MLLHLDLSGEVPIYQQIRNKIVMGIASGKLAAGEKLPTIRTLADEMGVNMMTVSKAYQLLKQEGYIMTDRRSGAVVCSRETGDLSPEMVENLRLRLCELRLAGMSRQDVLALCTRLLDKEEQV